MAVESNKAGASPEITEDRVVDEVGFVSFMYFLAPRFIREKYVKKHGRVVQQESNHIEPVERDLTPDMLASLKENEKKKINSKLSTLTDEFKDKQLSVNEVLKFLEIRKRADFDKELFGYLIYLLFFIVMILWIMPVSLSFEEVDVTRRYFSSEMDEAYTDYDSIVTLDNVYEFMATTIAMGLYAGNGSIGTNIRVIGLPLLRQVRVKPSDCQMEAGFDKCYGFFVASKEEKQAFGPVEDPERYQYHTGYTALQPSYIFTRDSHISKLEPYGTGAFGIVMPYGEEATKLLIEQLQNDTWIDRSTRAVAIDFGLINGDLGLITSVQYMFEFSPSSRIQPTRRIISFPLLTPKSSKTSGEFVFYVLFVIGGAYYIFSEVSQAMQLKTAYFSDSWNIFELIYYMVDTALIINIAIYINSSTEMHDLISSKFGYDEPVTYINTQPTALVYYGLQNVIGISCMFAFIKVFKFFRLNKRLNLLGETLSQATGDLAAFVVIFIVIFISFSFQGYFYFGYEVQEYHNFPTSVLSTFRILSGDSDYESLQGASPVFAPFFYLLFIVSVILILVNVFVAILNEYYEQATEDSRKQLMEQRSSFGGETDYDLIERIRAVHPHLHPFRGRKFVAITANDPVIIVAMERGSFNEDVFKELHKDDKKVKILFLRSNAVDSRRLIEILPDDSNIQFSPKSSPYPYVLSVTPVNMLNLNEEMPDTHKEIGEAVKTLKGYSFKVCRSLDDFNVDQPIFLQMDWGYRRRYCSLWLSHTWTERMTVKANIPKFVTDSQLSIIFKKLKQQYAFNRRSDDEASEEIHARSFYEFLMDYGASEGKKETQEEEKKEIDLDETGLSEEEQRIRNEELLRSVKEEKRITKEREQKLKKTAIEKAVQEFYDEKAAASTEIYLRFDEFVRELKIDLSMSGSKESIMKTTSDLIHESYSIFKTFPNSCFSKLDKDSAINNYKPRSINTSGIDLGRFDHLIESISKHVHDQWTISKLDAGWRFAPMRNDKAKEHHNMVPYEELTEGDKSYDRKMAQKTIKLILYFGYDIKDTKKEKDVPMKTWPEYQDRLPKNYDITMPDVGTIALEEDVLELADILAENAHDEWARGRQTEGWKYAEVGNFEKKESDFMLPYYMMTPQMRKNDLNTVVATLQFLIYKGYVIARPSFSSAFQEFTDKLRPYCQCFCQTTSEIIPDQTITTYHSLKEETV